MQFSHSNHLVSIYYTQMLLEGTAMNTILLESRGSETELLYEERVINKVPKTLRRRKCYFLLGKSKGSREEVMFKLKRL